MRNSVIILKFSIIEFNHNSPNEKHIILLRRVAEIKAIYMKIVGREVERLEERERRIIERRHVPG